MIQFEIKNSTSLKDICDGIILWKFSNEDIKFDYFDYQEILKQTNPDLSNYGKITTILHSHEALKPIIIIGSGDINDFSSNKLRFLTAKAIQSCQTLDISSIAIPLPNIDLSEEQVAQAIVEGIILGTYSFSYYKQHKTKNNIKSVLLITKNAHLDKLLSIINTAEIVAQNVNLARDMVNHPSNHMTPTQMSLQAQQLETLDNLTVTIFDESAIREHNMQALLAVAKGSNEPAKFIILNYNGNPESDEKIALVGKGITFDSGGISIKPSQGMEDMKDDMAGAAAVISALKSIAELKLKINVMGLVPCTENMPSGNALKPGDIISSLNGKSIEIISTDAEGRLILADAIAYAVNCGAACIIDIATLTGACVVALGNIASGVISNNQEWCNKLLDAANRTGEKMWQLPAYDEYKELIKSSTADLKNSGGRYAGAITAGMFLAEFTNNVPWIHIDIAGTANLEKEDGYNLKGATGIGVRTLVQFCKDLASC